MSRAERIAAGRATFKAWVQTRAGQREMYYLMNVEYRERHRINGHADRIRIWKEALREWNQFKREYAAA